MLDPRGGLPNALLDERDNARNHCDCLGLKQYNHAALRFAAEAAERPAVKRGGGRGTACARVGRGGRSPVVVAEVRPPAAS